MGDLWGDEQRGIGELMTEQPPGVSVIVCGHAAFFRNYDQTYADWMDRFADDLFTPANVEDSDRLRLLQWALYGLVRQLDEQGAYDGDWIERSADEISRTPSQESATTHEQDMRKHLAALKPWTSSLSGCRRSGSDNGFTVVSWAYGCTARVSCLAVSCAYTRGPWRSRAVVGPALGPGARSLAVMAPSVRIGRPGDGAGIARVWLDARPSTLSLILGTSRLLMLMA